MENETYMGLVTNYELVLKQNGPVENASQTCSIWMINKQKLGNQTTTVIKTYLNYGFKNIHPLTLLYVCQCCIFCLRPRHTGGF